MPCPCTFWAIGNLKLGEPCAAPTGLGAPRESGPTAPAAGYVLSSLAGLAIGDLKFEIGNWGFLNELTAQQMAILERLVTGGFSIVAFPLYANAVGVRRGSYAALLDPVAGGGFRLFGEPCILLDGNLTVRVADKVESWFVWKKQRVEATAERVGELGRFVSELRLLLEPRV
jgi:hypothetical protein